MTPNYRRLFAFLLPTVAGATASAVAWLMPQSDLALLTQEQQSMTRDLQELEKRAATLRSLWIAETQMTTQAVRDIGLTLDAEDALLTEMEQIGVAIEGWKPEAAANHILKANDIHPVALAEVPPRPKPPPRKVRSVKRPKPKAR
jgi:hypothetical protein